MTKFRKLNRPTGHRMSMLRVLRFMVSEKNKMDKPINEVNQMKKVVAAYERMNRQNSKDFQGCGISASHGHYVQAISCSILRIYSEDKKGLRGNSATAQAEETQAAETHT
nr:hypothetical protein [Tanacetum cinerariifolium]